MFCTNITRPSKTGDVAGQPTHRLTYVCLYIGRIRMDNDNLEA
jgi:hypothetical protein